MESPAILDDGTRQQLVEQFNDLTLGESQRVIVAAKLVYDAAKRYAARFVARFNNGEQLSDRELALICYTGEKEEQILKQIIERKISFKMLEKYIVDFSIERMPKQAAVQVCREMLAVGVIASRPGWMIVKNAIEAKAGLSVCQCLTSAPPQFWALNFAVSGLFFVADLVSHLQLYFKGKITGKQLAKKTTSSLISNGLAVPGGHLGMAIGAVLGTFLGPVGMFIGSMIGGMIGGIAMSLLGSFATEMIWHLFDKDDQIPAREQLARDARKTLIVAEKDDFETITKQWRKQVLEFHPDKHPNADEQEKKWFALKFQEVHMAYLILKEQEKERKRISAEEIARIARSSPLQVYGDGWGDEDFV